MCRKFPDIQGENPVEAFLSAMADDVRVLRYAPATLTNDQTFILAAVEINELTFQHASTKLKANDAFYERALTVNRMVCVERVKLNSKEAISGCEFVQYIKENPIVTEVGRHSPQSLSSPFSPSLFATAEQQEDDNEPVQFAPMGGLRSS
ncbi:MAG: DUF4116 domain-containing protein [Gammaproteobacteria bacterium]|nr:DUF4116 domain-containing protein [Gammaproteobacteria bacterium]